MGVHAVLVVFCFSWIAVIALPGFDKTSPALQVTDSGRYIPITELFSFLLALVVSICQYELFKRCVGGNVSRVQERIATCLIAATACGSGQHFVCATIQVQLLENDKVFPFVEFLHEIFSHHVLFGGWYALVLYTTWSEGSYILQLHDTKEKRQVHSSSPLITLFTVWVLPVLMGVFCNVVAPPTHTQYLLAMFNIAIGTILCVLYVIQPSSLRLFLTNLLPRMTVLVFFIKSAIVSVLLNFLSIMII